MPLQQRTRRFGAWVIFCALLLRLYAIGILDHAAAWLSQPNIAALLIYLETGRTVRFSLSQGTHQVESPAPWTAPQPLPVFSSEDAGKVGLYYDCMYRPDLASLTAQRLNWYLPLPEPTVLVLHSHTTESYTQVGEDYAESSAYRTLDEDYNMLSIGDRVIDVLAQYGISAIHDRELHDYPEYTGAYNHSRESAQYYLQKYPSIQLILDLHRDAMEQNGKQLTTTATVNGEPSAQLMLVMGTDASGLTHNAWEQNLSLGLKLQLQLERQTPGITRPMALRAQRFNQDLLPGALLVEIGAAGNTHEEALLAAEQLAHAIAALSRGTQ